MECDQNVQERRDIRKIYRGITQDLTDNHDELINPSNTLLEEKLQKASQAFANVTTPRECVEDARVLSMIATMGRQKVQQIKTDQQGFDENEFVLKIREKLFAAVPVAGNEPRILTSEHMARLGRASQDFLQVAPSFNCMLGTSERAQRVTSPRPVRQRRAPQPEGSRTEGQWVKGTAIEGQEVTTDDVEMRILPALARECALAGGYVNYFEFVVDPGSFSNTIENIFYVSFLVRDRFAGLTERGGQPMLYHRSHAMQLSQQHGITAAAVVDQLDDEEEKLSTTLMCFNMKLWKECIEVYNVTRPMVPPRNSTTEDSGSHDDSDQLTASD